MKKSVFKKLGIITLLGVSTLNLFPEKSHAVIGVITADIPMLALGGGLIAAGGPAMILSDGRVIGPVTFLSALAEVAGAVLLDEQGKISPRFAELTEESAKSLGVTTEEMSTYNSELSDINALYQTIVSDTRKHAREGTSRAGLLEFANQEWTVYGEALSPEARSVLSKVRGNLALELK